MMVVSNGVRIATLMLLANYAIRSFYIGSYITRAECFFLLGLRLLLPIY